MSLAVRLQGIVLGLGVGSAMYGYQNKQVLFHSEIIGDKIQQTRSYCNPEAALAKRSVPPEEERIPMFWGSIADDFRSSWNTGVKSLHKKLI